MLIVYICLFVLPFESFFGTAAKMSLRSSFNFFVCVFIQIFLRFFNVRWNMCPIRHTTKINERETQKCRHQSKMHETMQFIDSFVRWNIWIKLCAWKWHFHKFEGKNWIGIDSFFCIYLLHIVPRSDFRHFRSFRLGRKAEKNRWTPSNNKNNFQVALQI